MHGTILQVKLQDVKFVVPVPACACLPVQACACLACAPVGALCACLHPIKCKRVQACACTLALCVCLPA